MAQELTWRGYTKLCDVQCVALDVDSPSVKQGIFVGGRSDRTRSNNRRPRAGYYIICSCNDCKGLPLEEGEGGRVYAVSGFENHGNRGAAKKWRFSLTALTSSRDSEESIRLGHYLDETSTAFNISRGTKLRVWDPEQEWMVGTVEAIQTEQTERGHDSQLYHIVRFEDGSVQTLILAAEKFEVITRKNINGPGPSRTPNAARPPVLAAQRTPLPPCRASAGGAPPPCATTRTPFFSAPTFRGACPGYVFKKGSKGLGYYLDPKAPQGTARGPARAVLEDSPTQERQEQGGGAPQGDPAPPFDQEPLAEEEEDLQDMGDGEDAGEEQDGEEEGDQENSSDDGEDEEEEDTDGSEYQISESEDEEEEDIMKTPRHRQGTTDCPGAPKTRTERDREAAYTANAAANAAGGVAGGAAGVGMGGARRDSIRRQSPFAPFLPHVENEYAFHVTEEVPHPQLPGVSRGPRLVNLPRNMPGTSNGGRGRQGNQRGPVGQSGQGDREAAPPSRPLLGKRRSYGGAGGGSEKRAREDAPALHQRANHGQDNIQGPSSARRRLDPTRMLNAMNYLSSGMSSIISVFEENDQLHRTNAELIAECDRLREELAAANADAYNLRRIMGEALGLAPPGEEDEENDEERDGEE